MDVDKSLFDNFYLLLTNFFSELASHFETSSNGIKLIKAVIRQLVEIYSLEKLNPKIYLRCSELLAVVVKSIYSHDPDFQFFNQSIAD